MGGIRRAGVKALSTCELQALSRRNLNILLAEYPEVGEELKRVARDRASAAKKGSKSNEKPAPISLVKVGSDSELDSKISSPVESKDEVVQQDDTKYDMLLEKEIDAIVETMSKKLRHDLVTSANRSAASIPGQEEKDETT